MIGSMSHAAPYRWTGRIAFVRSVIAASIRAGSIVNVTGSMSTKTGTAPTLLMDSGVAKNVNGVVMTSSPGPTPSARSPITSASVPEFTPIACFTPRYDANSLSSAPTFGPRMNRPDRTPVRMASIRSSHWASISGGRSRTGIRDAPPCSSPLPLQGFAIGLTISPSALNACRDPVLPDRQCLAAIARPADAARGDPCHQRVARDVLRHHRAGGDERRSADVIPHTIVAFAPIVAPRRTSVVA